MKRSDRVGSRLPVGILVIAVLAGGGGCAARRRPAAEEGQALPAQVLYQKALAELAKGDLRRAKLLLERTQYTDENRAATEPLVRLALADVAYFAGDDVSLIDARAKYLDFVTLYGDHPRAPYAQLQAGACSLKQVNHPSRDQTQTRVAMADLREVRRRYPSSPYTRVAALYLLKAENNLAEHDFQVGRFYFKRRVYFAAAERFRSLLSAYPTIDEREKIYYFLGESLLRANNGVEGRIYLDKLLADYPTGEYAQAARKALNRADGLEKGQRKG